MALHLATELKVLDYPQTMAVGWNLERTIVAKAMLLVAHCELVELELLVDSENAQAVHYFDSLEEDWRTLAYSTGKTVAGMVLT